MTNQDLAKLETELDLTLPAAYRALMLEHPGFFRHYELCDHVDPLLYDNRFLREDGFFGENWPKTFYALGNDGSGNVYFITTEPFDGNVYFADHEGGPGPNELEAAKRHDSLAGFVDSLRNQHDIILADARKMNEQIANRKWWQFWIPTAPVPMDDD